MNNEEIKCIHCGGVNEHVIIRVDYGDGDVREEKCPELLDVDNHKE